MLHLLFAERGKTQENHKQRDTEMQAAMHCSLRDAKACGIVVITRKQKQHRRRDDGQGPHQDAKAKLRIIGFLDRLQLIRCQMTDTFG